MYGLCLPPGCLCHAGRRAPGRGREQNLRALCLKAADNRIDGCGLTGTGTARDDEKSRLHRGEHRAPLGLIEYQARRLFFEQGQGFGRAHTGPRFPKIQLSEHRGDVQFHAVVVCEVDLAVLALLTRSPQHHALLHLEFREQLF